MFMLIVDVFVSTAISVILVIIFHIDSRIEARAFSPAARRGGAFSHRKNMISAKKEKSGYD